MIRILFVFLLIVGEVAFASKYFGDEKTEAKIIEKICMIVLNKNNVFVYSPTNSNFIFKYSNNLIHTDNCGKADIVILTKNESVEGCRNKPIFTTKYYLLKQNPNAIGALYWHKGRPNIIIIKERLEKFNLIPPEELLQFIESEKDLW
ncbi:hypothetical protein [Persephonella sp.]